MRLPFPRTLTTQMVLLLGLALLAAQLVSFGFVWNDRTRLTRASNEAPAITRFAQTAADVAAADPQFRDLVLEDGSRRGARFQLVARPSIAESDRDDNLEGRVRDGLEGSPLARAQVRATRIVPSARTGDIAVAPPAAPNQSPRVGRNPPEGPRLVMAVRLADGSWLEGRLGIAPQDQLFMLRLAGATLLLYLFVLAAVVWGTRSINRPLRDLTEAARAFAHRSSAPELRPRGPEDVREAMEAFNAMNGRIVSLLEEKDYLLGAIGHDLRTPLASLRLRIESMEPENERNAAVAKIAEMAGMLEDILVLARNGRTETRRVDLTALVGTLADEYEDLGKPVSFAPSPRVVASVAPGLLRRALRNLIDNAVIYGGSAELAVSEHGEHALIEVRDLGPGIPEQEHERMLKPFQRLETSRNRGTGGTGLGLAIARSVAQSHGGTLTLAENRPSGLIARLELPCQASARIHPV